MKLHSPQFEKALRRQVRQAVRSSPELKREYRRARRFRRANRFAWIVFLWMTIPFGLVVREASVSTGHVATGLVLINLGMLGLVSVLAHGLRTRLHTSPENLAVVFLPMPREKMFRWQLQKFCRSSLWWLPYVLAGFVGLAFTADFSAGQWAATFLIAVLSWATLLAVVVFGLARIPSAPFQLVTAGLGLALFAVIFGKDLVRPAVLRALDTTAPELNLFLPTGWPVSLFEGLTGGNSAWLLILLLPISIVFWAARHSLVRLFERFQFHEYVQAEARDLVAGEGASAGRPAQLGLTAIEEIILSRDFMNPPEWSRRGWLELRLWRWLSPRERVLSDFAFPNGAVITAQWLLVFKVFGIAAVIALAVRPANLALSFWVLAGGLFFALCLILGLVNTPGRTFQPLQFSGVNIPMYAGYGVGFRELSRFLFKCSVVQIPMLLAFGAVAGTATAFVAGLSIGVGMQFGLKAGFLLFASRFIFITMSFSSGTDDTRRWRPRSILLIFAFVVFGLAFVGLGVGGLFFPRQPLAWLFCLGAAGDACVFFLVYQWFYNCFGRFDLISLPKR